MDERAYRAFMYRQQMYNQYKAAQQEAQSKWASLSPEAKASYARYLQMLADKMSQVTG